MIGFIRRNFVNRLIMSPMLKNSKNRLISFWNTKCNWSWLEDDLLESFPALILLCKTIQGEERKIKCQAIKVYTFCWQNWNQEFTSSQRSTTGNPWQDRQKHFRLTPRCNIFLSVIRIIPNYRNGRCRSKTHLCTHTQSLYHPFTEETYLFSYILKISTEKMVWYTEEDSMSTSTTNRKSWLFYTQNFENSKYVLAFYHHLSNWEYTAQLLLLKSSQNQRISDLEKTHKNY